MSRLSATVQPTKSLTLPSWYSSSDWGLDITYVRGRVRVGEVGKICHKVIASCARRCIDSFVYQKLFEFFFNSLLSRQRVDTMAYRPTEIE